jgi:hypothetical protein
MLRMSKEKVNEWLTTIVVGGLGLIGAIAGVIEVFQSFMKK